MSKILIVEDDLSIQALLHDFIEEAGHNVVLASDGVEALAKYSEQPFDLILLDIMLPKIDGYGVCEVIRQKSDVPIIMLTALDGEKIRLRGWICRRTIISQSLFPCPSCCGKSPPSCADLKNGQTNRTQSHIKTLLWI